VLGDFVNSPKADPFWADKHTGIMKVAEASKVWNSSRAGIEPQKVRQSAVVVLLLLVLEGLVFGRHLLGELSPPWDFYNSYSTDAYYWWTFGGFFNPPEWIPTLWEGYPSALLLQNSAWYLPTGLISLFGPYTIQSAVILAALHVAFGSLGTYVLARKLGLAHIVALFALVASFFAIGYFSNAEHIDIARAYAFIPWVLLVASPYWPWRTAFGVVAAILLLWQFVTGAYPGTLVSTAYAGAAWVAVMLFVRRPKVVDFIAPLAVAVLAAALLSAPRIWPYFLMSGDVAKSAADTSVFDWTTLGTLLFPYGSDKLPNDISMRSFFVPATIFTLVFFAQRASLAFKAGITLFSVALILGIPGFPWFEAVQGLPGMSLSRFSMSDFKPFMILGLTLLASSGLQGLQAKDFLPSAKRFWFAASLFGLALSGMVFIGVAGPFSRLEWLPPVAIAATALILVILIKDFRSPRLQLFNVSLLILLTMISGLASVYSTPLPWKTQRAVTEKLVFGGQISDLIASNQAGSGLTVRPARQPLRADYGLADLWNPVSNRGVYTGEIFIGGYLNLRMSKAQQLITDSLLEPKRGAEFAKFLASEGHLLVLPKGGSSAQSRFETCATSANCPQVEVRPTSYSPGHFKFSVSAASSSSVVLNEAYYEGWQAQACDPNAKCQRLDVARDATGLVRLDLPPGKYILDLEFKTQGRQTGWVLFAFGAAISLAAAIMFKLYKKKPIS